MDNKKFMERHDIHAWKIMHPFSGRVETMTVYGRDRTAAIKNAAAALDVTTAEINAYCLISRID